MEGSPFEAQFKEHLMADHSGSRFERCTTCGKFDFVDRHRCAPLYDIERNYARKDRAPEWEAHRPVRGPDAEAAAEKWADEYDSESGDHPLLNGVSIHIRARLAGSNDAWEEFEVTGEVVPEYTARAI